MNVRFCKNTAKVDISRNGKRQSTYGTPMPDGRLRLSCGIIYDSDESAWFDYDGDIYHPWEWWEVDLEDPYTRIMLDVADV